jgi:hypothetical protein
LVGVFNPQNELTAMLLGKAVVEQSDVSGADMGIAGRRWRDASADGGHGMSRKNIKSGDETKGEW